MAKLCECGCGEPAPISKNNWKARGYVAGQPMRFVAGHQNRNRTWSNEHRMKFTASMTGHDVSESTRAKISQAHKIKGIRPPSDAKSMLGRSRELSPTWKGGISYTNGRKCIYKPNHPRAHTNGYVYEHILIAEEMLGRPLAAGEVVHHIDGDIKNNQQQNLHVFKSQAEHSKHHKDAGDIV